MRSTRSPSSSAALSKEAIHHDPSPAPLRARLVLAGVALLAGCTAGPDFKPPDKPKEQGYTPEKLAPTTSSAPVEGGQAQSFVERRDIPGDWWTLFRSQELTGLIDQALKANPDLDVAQASLRQANENLYAQQATLFPDRHRQPLRAERARERCHVRPVRDFVLLRRDDVVAQRLLHARHLRRHAPLRSKRRRRRPSTSAIQLEATYLTLTSNVVVAAVNLASLRGQIAATEQIIKLETDAARRRAHASSTWAAPRRPTCWRRKRPCAPAQATLPPLQKQLAQQRNQLMTSARPVRRARMRAPAFELAALQSAAGAAAQPAVASSSSSGPTCARPRRSCTRPAPRSASPSSNQLPQFTITGQLGITPARHRQPVRARHERLERSASASPRRSSTRGTLAPPEAGGDRGLRRGGRAVSQHRALGLPGRGQRAARAAIRRRCAAQRRSRPSARRPRASTSSQQQYQARRHQLPDPAQRRSRPISRRVINRVKAQAAPLRRHRRAVPGAGRRLVEPHRRRSRVAGQAEAGSDAAARRDPPPTRRTLKLGKDVPWPVEDRR